MTKPETTPQAPLSAIAPERLPDNLILGFRTGLATAESQGIGLQFDTTIGLGGVSVSVLAKAPDGTRISETLSLKPLLDEWGARLVAELRAKGETGE